CCRGSSPTSTTSLEKWATTTGPTASNAIARRFRPSFDTPTRRAWHESGCGRRTCSLPRHWKRFVSDAAPSARPPASDLDEHDPMLDDRLVRLHRHDAGRGDDLAGPDVEHALVEVALDVVAVDAALGQRAGAVRARIVGDVERAVEVEDRDGQTGGFDRPDPAHRDIPAPAQASPGAVQARRKCRYRLG